LTSAAGGNSGRQEADSIDWRSFHTDFVSWTFTRVFVWHIVCWKLLLFDGVLAFLFGLIVFFSGG